MKVLRNLLGDNEAMLSLYLTRKQQGRVEEVELLLNSYAADLDDIDTEVKILIDVIEDTDQFISAHMDSVRNEIIKMSLFTEVGGVIMGFGAVVSGIFGMNLDNKMDVYPLQGAPEDKVSFYHSYLCARVSNVSFSQGTLALSCSVRWNLNGHALLHPRLYEEVLPVAHGHQQRPQLHLAEELLQPRGRFGGARVQQEEDGEGGVQAIRGEDNWTEGD